MDIKCEQMEMLIAFYIEGGLSDNMKRSIEKHMSICPNCRAKYNFVKSLFSDMKEKASVKEENTYVTAQHKSFRDNLSAYVDNELPQEENIKMKKYTICNKKARKELEEVYHIRKLMSDSFNKTKTSANKDFSKHVLRHLNFEPKDDLSFSPLIKVGFAFVVTVIAITAAVIYMLSF